MKKIVYPVMGLVLMISYSSCLKDKNIMDPDNSPAVVEFVNPSNIQSPTTSPLAVAEYSNSFEIAPEVDYKISVNYAGAYPAPQDVTVKVEIDPAVLESYNTANKTSYVQLPSDLYTIGNTTVTIKKGERQAVIPIKLKTEKFDFAKNYAIPAKIVSATAGNISGNFGMAVFRVGAKNQWDGTYAHTYTSTLGNGTNNVTMKTTGANSLTFGLIGVYSNAVNLTIDPATNKVTVDVPSLAPTVTDPSSNWNPATKTFYLKYTTPNRTFEETFVKK